MRLPLEMTSASPDAFCAEIRTPLVGSLTLFTGSRGLVEDLAQEALASAFQRWDDLEDPRSWTFAVAFNLARSAFRRRAAERRAHERIAALAATQSGDPDTADAIAVRDALRALPARQRQVLICRFYARFSVAETAAAMRCPEGTVKSLTSRAITALRGAGLGVNEEVASDA